jgi:hypothetical protein
MLRAIFCPLDVVYFAVLFGTTRVIDPPVFEKCNELSNDMFELYYRAAGSA